MSFLELTGKVFGQVTVIEKDIVKSKIKKRSFWHCICNCGESISISGETLIRNSLGCCCGKYDCQTKTNSNRNRNLVGQKFAKLLVVKLIGKNKSGNKIYQCNCECGNYVNVSHGNLTSGNSSSCGCIRKKQRLTHGMSYLPEYGIWSGIKARCMNKNNKSYSYYGGRGIKICENWEKDFPQFYKDVGPRPGPTYSIDRIDSDGNYEPGNVRWATSDAQWENRKARGKTLRKVQEESLSSEEANQDILVLLMSIAEQSSKFSKIGQDLIFGDFVKEDIRENSKEIMICLSNLLNKIDVRLEDCFKEKAEV